MDVDATEPDQRVVEAAAQLPARGGVTGWAALWWLGGVWFTGVGSDGDLRPVPLAVGSGHRARPRAGLEISQEVVTPANLTRSGGVRLTGALWSVSYSMRKAASDEAAVVAFDMAAFNDLVSVAELRAFVDRHLVARQGVERVRRVLGFLDENCWSPMEPVLQLTWERELGVLPLMNRPVFDQRGRFIGTPDAIDPAAGVYGMYDGGLHLAGSVRHRDIEKEAAYRSIGLEGATMMASDLADRSPFSRRLREAYGRASRLPSAERRWTIDPPRSWKDTTTVDARRALSTYDRERLLAHRRRAA
ncbi:hypothetical protein EUA93_09640 [Nocardioides oleivorans]|uniref:Uncharacterized protein n=1 Tax=Nocardioides oleivorans TaxID=273676 RepID=A0A4Q2RZ55_9ACTN|nr:hypothetical protein [Nocardioides oleivorans]RYB94580.1 hypothetical protein EUA93_09640 [Nocardioides oleivorans]